MFCFYFETDPEFKLSRVAREVTKYLSKPILKVQGWAISNAHCPLQQEILTNLYWPSPRNLHCNKEMSLKKIFLLNIYLGFQIQVPIQYYNDLVNVNKNFVLFKSYPTAFMAERFSWVYS